MVSGAETIGIVLVISGLWVIWWKLDYDQADKAHREARFKMNERFQKEADDRRKKWAEEDKLLKFDIES